MKKIIAYLAIFAMGVYVGRASSQTSLLAINVYNWPKDDTEGSNEETA